MSSIYHNSYNDIAPSFEALMKEFVIDPIALDTKSRETRRDRIYDYWKKIYSDTNSVKKTYEITRKWAQQVYVQRYTREGATPAFPKYPDEQIDFWSEPAKEKAKVKS